MDTNAYARCKADNAPPIARAGAQITLDSIGDGIISTDKEGKVTYLDSVAERMTGWTRGEAIGRMSTEVFRFLHCETREPAPNPMEVAVRHGDAVGLAANTVLVRRDGHELAIEDSTAPIHEQVGKIVGPAAHDSAARSAGEREHWHQRVSRCWTGRRDSDRVR